MKEALRKAQAYLDWSKTFEKRIMTFDDDFRPMSHEPYEEGMYVTIRCGLSGIYQVLNRWEDGRWQMVVPDGSTTIAYSKEPVKVPEL